MLINTIFEGAVEQILDVAKRFSLLLEKAEFRAAWSAASHYFCTWMQKDPLAARLTRDVDIAISRRDLVVCGIQIED